MNLQQLVACAKDKSRFESVQDYIDFACRYLEFSGTPGALQAEIVSQNEPHYKFYQYKEDGLFSITRPMNARLMIVANDYELLQRSFLKTFDAVCEVKDDDKRSRTLLCNAIYTMQQSIGATLDALPAGQSNTARKINGDLFERLIRLLICRLGVSCDSGTVSVPVSLDGEEQFQMSYQHDLIIRQGELVKAIGGVKTSSKDRIDKIFIDKFLYCKLTDRFTPHIAIFLNDVQRKKTRKENQYGVSSTFLPGRFKGYTMKLNPLDGVYYCDLRPNMATDKLLKQHIRTIDRFFCNDLWNLVQSADSEVGETVG